MDYYSFLAAAASPPPRAPFNANVKLVYLPPYSPDLSAIEEFFAELKAFIKHSWHNYKENLQQGFNTFLECCIDIVGGKKNSARGHAGLNTEEL
jgi:DDE superfamily endonuclease